MVLLGMTAIGWRLRTKIERRMESEDLARSRALELEDKMREDRIATYYEILEPFMLLLMSDAAWAKDPNNKNKNKGEIALTQMLSLDYRKQGFRLSLVGSDGVVSAYNDLMQHSYSLAPGEGGANPSVEPSTMLSLLGNLLLEIRRGVGNESTQLDHWQMLEWFLTDARGLRAQQADSAGGPSGRR